jgi:hypothetical protein
LAKTKEPHPLSERLDLRDSLQTPTQLDSLNFRKSMSPVPPAPERIAGAFFFGFSATIAPLKRHPGARCATPWRVDRALLEELAVLSR